MTLYKVPLIVASAYLFTLAFTDPSTLSNAAHKSVTVKEQSRIKTANRSIWASLYEVLMVLPSAHMAFRSLFWISTAFDTAAIFIHEFNLQDSAASSGLGEMFPAAASQSKLTTSCIFGVFLTAAGSLIRIRCFKELGSQFTFALSLRQDHKLITSGPYSIVRHPSYTGGMIAVVGVVLMFMGSGSWWMEAGRFTAFGYVWAAGFVCGLLLVLVSTLRGSKEDEFLMKEFGDQWREWAKRVPYRYVPGII